MAINSNPFFEFGKDLTPEQLAQLWALVPADYRLGAADPNRMRGTDDPENPGPVSRSWSLPGGQFAPTLTWSPGQREVGSGQDVAWRPTVEGGSWMVSQPRNISTWGGGDMGGSWDQNGKWIGFSGGATDLRGLANWAASSILAGYGADYLNGLESAGSQYGGAAAEILGADTAGYTAGMGGGAGGVGGAAAGAGAGSQYGGAAAEILGADTTGYTAGMGNGASAAGAGSRGAGAGGGAGGLGAGQVISGLLGAAAGVADSQDKTNTTSRDPWAPAQPYLRGLLEDGANLYRQYRAQPFSTAQQTAYGNLGGLLDSINTNAPGLLAGVGANASGANNYDRSNPRRQLTGSTAMDLSKWMPGLLGNFGTTGGR